MKLYTQSLPLQIVSTIPLLPDEVFEICFNIKIMRFGSNWDIQKIESLEKGWVIHTTRLHL